MFYSEPRLTLDIDIAVALDSWQLSELPQCFPPPDYYCPPDEVLSAENQRECRAHFSVIHIPSGYKADFYPSQRDAFFAWAWLNKREATLPSGPLFYAPPEYIIVWKTAYFVEGGGEKHIRDIRRMLEISSSEIDSDLLREELERRGLWSAFEAMQRDDATPL
jgi:hypothetical protein